MEETDNTYIALVERVDELERLVLFLLLMLKKTNEGCDKHINKLYELVESKADEEGE